LAEEKTQMKATEDREPYHVLINKIVGSVMKRITGRQRFVLRE
jgi:hypothetical protein